MPYDLVLKVFRNEVNIPAMIANDMALMEILFLPCSCFDHRVELRQRSCYDYHVVGLKLGLHSLADLCLSVHLSLFLSYLSTFLPILLPQDIITQVTTKHPFIQLACLCHPSHQLISHPNM